MPPWNEVEAALAETERFWDEHAERRQSAPDDSFDLIVNRWLCISDIGVSRLGAQRSISARRRVRFSRSTSGRARADATRPELCRAHLRTRPSRQFVEGDVQHWWHPPSGRGTRTLLRRLLWLPARVASYVSQSGDESVLDEEAASRHRCYRPINRRPTSCRTSSERASCSSMRYAPLGTR